MRTTIVCTCLSAFYFLANSGGINAQTQKKLTYDSKDFNSVEISSAITAEIKQSQEYKIEILCDANDESYIYVEKENGELSIEVKNRKGNTSHKVSATIYMPDIKKLEVSGASSVTLSGFNSDKFKVELSGASNLKANMTAKEMEVEITGASSMFLEGSILNVDLEISGASVFDAMNAKITDEFLLEGSGASHIQANVDGDIQIELAGASTFEYSGSGDILKQEVGGASNVIKK